MNIIPVYKISGKTGLTGTAHTSIDGKDYNMVVKSGVVTEMYIDGKKIPSEKIVDHKPVLDKFFNKMKANEEQGKRDREQAMRDSEQAVIDNEQAVKDNEQAVKDSKRAKRDSEQAKIARERAKRDSEQAKGDIEQAKRDIEQAMRDSEQAKRDSEQAIKDSRIMDKIIAELISDNILKSKKDIHSIYLNATNLVVNGVIQPTSIHKKYKDKYVTDSLTWVYETR
jgi:hypothetical protein